MKTISKKVVSIEIGDKKYALSDDVTLDIFLSSLGLDASDIMHLKPTREGFNLSLK
ncbi:MAG: hypothetical protein ACT4N5_07875 [Nitrosopumilaceae archaeon]